MQVVDGRAVCTVSTYEIGKCGTTVRVLVEGPSKRDAADWCGRTDTNKMVVFRHEDQRGYIIGDTVDVVIERANAATLFGMLA